MLGDVVDPVLAKRLPRQDLILRDLLLAPGERDVGERVPNYLARKRETANRTKRPWRKALLPPSLRRLPEEISGKYSLRDIRTARVWLTGLIAFRIEDFWLPTLQYYVGKMSLTSATFVRTPPRWVVQRFISAVLRGQVRYLNWFGPASGGNLQDPLLQRAAQCLPRVIRISPTNSASKQRRAFRSDVPKKPEHNLRILGQEAQLLELLCGLPGQVIG